MSLYARFTGEPFATHINTAFFGTRAGADLFGDPVQHHACRSPPRCRSAVAPSLAIGFVLPPAAAQVFKAHMGFSLYNMGFTAGLVGTLVVALYKSYGFVPDPVFIWTTGNNLLLGQLSCRRVRCRWSAVGFWFDRAGACAGCGG